MLARSVRSTRTLAFIAAAVLTTACDKAVTFNAPETESPESMLDQASAKASSLGNIDAADAYALGAEALRLGIQPSEIVVSVKGDVSRYQAIVVGTVESLSPGDTALKRTLVAWEGESRRTALLDVSTLGNVGSFSSEFEPASDPRSRAQGTWLDLVRDTRWIATTGTAQISVANIGSECDARRLDGFRCVYARFDLLIDGLFRLYGASPDDGAPAVRIQTEARGVSGVILASNDGSGRTPVRGGEVTRRGDDTRRSGGETRRGDR